MGFVLIGVFLFRGDVNPSQLVDASDQVRSAIWSAFLAWAFTPVLCKVVRHGQVIVMVHDGQLRDVHIEYGTRIGESPPKQT